MGMAAATAMVSPAGGPAAPQIMPAAMAPAPDFQVGDTFHFRMGPSLVSETVEKVDGNGVWWRDNMGRRRVGSEPVLMPARPVVSDGGSTQVADMSIEATGNLFPLLPGRSVAFR
jgi:hypothetical protein